MDEPTAEALAEFRRFNYDRIYMRPASVAQCEAVIRVLRALVEYYADRPNTLPFDESDADDRRRTAAASRPRRAVAEALHEAVTYVAGMTDRFAFSASASPTWGGTARHCPTGVRRTAALTIGRPGRASTGTQSIGRTSTSFWPLRCPNFTLPGARANSVSSPPRPTFTPGWNLVPRWRTMIAPACTAPPSNTFTPRRLDSESRPFLVEPPPLVFDMSLSPS